MGTKSKQTQQGEELTTGMGSEDRVEAKIDRDLRDSFPASDPPGWTLGVKRRKAEKEEKDDSSTSASTDDTGEG